MRFQLLTVLTLLLASCNGPKGSLPTEATIQPGNSASRSAANPVADDDGSEIESLAAFRVTEGLQDQTKKLGDTVKFAVQSNGRRNSKTYAWFKDGKELPKCTTSVCEFTIEKKEDFGVYKVEITRRGKTVSSEAKLIEAGAGSDNNSGDNGSDNNNGGDTTTNPNAGTVPVLDHKTLPMPEVVAGKVELECARTYVGTLNLKGKSNVTVTTKGDCGPAVLTAVEPLLVWKSEGNDIWSAQVENKDVKDLIIQSARGVPQRYAPASLPSDPRQGGWLTGERAGDLSLQYSGSVEDGAKVIAQTVPYRYNEFAITGQSGGDLTLEALDGGTLYDPNIKFYLSNAYGFIQQSMDWATAGTDKIQLKISNPENYFIGAIGRGSKVIDADDSTGITIDNVVLLGGDFGISGEGAQRLTVKNVKIKHMSYAGVEASNSKNFVADKIIVQDAQTYGVYGGWQSGNFTVQNSTIESTGTLGKPANSVAAVAGETESQASFHKGMDVINNTIKDSAYLGISVPYMSLVENNTITDACKPFSEEVTLRDCGFIYNQEPWHRDPETDRSNTKDDGEVRLTVKGNTIKGGNNNNETVGLYFDDRSSNVIVKNNTVEGTEMSLFMHDGIKITAENNTFTNPTRFAVGLDGRTGNENGFYGHRIQNNTFNINNDAFAYEVNARVNIEKVIKASGNTYNVDTSRAGGFACINTANVNNADDLTDCLRYGFNQWRDGVEQDAIFR